MMLIQSGTLPMAWSIRRYLLALVLAVTLPLAALLAYSLQEGRRQALTDAEASALRISQFVAAVNQRFVNDARDMLAALAARPLVTEPDSGRCDPWLSEFKALLSRYANLAVADRNGELICPEAAAPAGGSASVAATLWFSRIKRDNRF